VQLALGGRFGGWARRALKPMYSRYAAAAHFSALNSTMDWDTIKPIPSNE
jgi:hypothetical protein